MAHAPELHGVFIPFTTPFDTSGNLSLAHLRDNLKRYNSTRLAGYVATGSTGEAILLSWAETEALWEMTVEAAGPEKVLIAGTAAESTAETIMRTRRAAQIGFAFALVRTPHYYQSQMTFEALTGFYHRLADASPIPILIYAIPQFTGITVEAPLVARLAQHPNIAGIKESSGSVQRAAEIRSAAPAGFRILVGSAPTFFPSLLVGTDGGILALADALPDACVALFEAAAAGDTARARGLHQQLLSAGKTLVNRYGVAGMKYALDRLGFYGGPVREPLRGLDEAAREEVDRVLAALEDRTSTPA